MLGQTYLTTNELQSLDQPQLSEILKKAEITIDEYKYGLTTEKSLVSNALRIKRKVLRIIRSGIHQSETTVNGALVVRSTTQMATSKDYFDMYLKRNGFVTLPHSTDSYAHFVNLEDKEMIVYELGEIALCRCLSMATFNDEIRDAVLSAGVCNERI